ncbi:hypothetical protein L3Q82_014654, partial [Scortum barcoo]
NGPSLLGRGLLEEIRLRWREIKLRHKVRVLKSMMLKDNLLQQVLSEHENVFKEELDTLKDMKITIHVKANATPRFFRPRMGSAGSIPMLKPVGTVRLCGDYKLTVNTVSSLEQYPIPRVEDLFAALTGGKQFSKLDINSAEVLVHYSADRELVLSCDASPYGVGAVLSHVMDDGSERPLGFMSRTLAPTEKRYSQLDKEGLAVMFGIKKFHKYLYGRAFTIYTDHKPLISLFNEKKPIPLMGSLRVQRWAVHLSAYEYNIVYKPGKYNPNADALSRLPLSEKVRENVIISLCSQKGDYAGPFLGEMFLLIVDAHSKWMDIYPVTSATSQVTIEKLRQRFSVFGLPQMLVSDNGTCFTSAESETFIRHVRSAPFHPSSNGLAERAVQTFKEGMRKMKGETLQTRLSRFLFSYRITPQTTTGLSPAELMMSWRLRSALDLLMPDVKTKVQQKQLKQKKTHDTNRKLRRFTPGDKVFIRNYSYGPKWIPGVVKRSLGPVSYTVIIGSGQVVKRNVDQERARLADTAPSSESENDLELVWDTDKETVGPVTSKQEEPPASEPVERGTAALPDMAAESAVRRSERDRTDPSCLCHTGEKKDFIKFLVCSVF